MGNPLHLLPDKRVVVERLGADRASRGFAFRSMLEVKLRITQLSQS